MNERQLTVEVADSLSGVAARDWNGLAGGDPFLSHEFLHALHETGCASPASGWTPRFLLARNQGKLTGAMPLYLKSHSYGEYVFDWAWADAYHRHGLDYYPKLVSAVPFTPVTGPRVLAATREARALLIGAALELADRTNASSLHCLFPPRAQAEEMAGCGMMLRSGVQFHWVNHGYATFDEFLAHMNHAKRKKIRQERRKVREAGITFRWLTGREATEADWVFFHRCYRATYRRHRSTPYLNLEFFCRIGAALPGDILLVIALRGAKPVAASLSVVGRDRLCGRYWGATEYHPALHFEACYYQPIEFCIARGIATFEGGAQGEHKVARGLLPVPTCSAHWLAHPEFAAAVDRFLAREGRAVGHYLDELAEHSPFKLPSPATAR